MGLNCLMHQIHNLLYLPASNLQEDVEIIIFPVAPPRLQKWVSVFPNACSQ